MNGNKRQTDFINGRVISQLKDRAAVGWEKYNTDMTRKDIDLFGWLQNLQEELLDAAVYVERLKYEMEDGK